MVLKGRLIVRSKSETLELTEGQVVIVQNGECVQYSTSEETEYITVLRGINVGGKKKIKMADGTDSWLHSI